MIIDAHVHIGITEKLSRGFSAEGYLRYMRENGVDRAVVMPNISSVTPTVGLNGRFFEEIGKTAGLFPLMLIDPVYPDSLDFVDRYAPRGFKYHPSIHQITASDMRLGPWYEAARGLNVPVLVHCGRNRISHISHLAAAARIWPDITFVGAHLGGGATELIEEALDLVWGVDNILLDTSAGKIPWLIEKAIDKLGDERILFGSDEPYADLGIALRCVEKCRMSDGIREIILHENAERVYGIDR